MKPKSKTEIAEKWSDIQALKTFWIFETRRLMSSSLSGTTNVVEALHIPKIHFHVNDLKSGLLPWKRCKKGVSARYFTFQKHQLFW